MEIEKIRSGTFETTVTYLHNGLRGTRVFPAGVTLEQIRTALEISETESVSETDSANRSKPKHPVPKHPVPKHKP